MKKIIIGKKENNIKYDFRETCFGIIEKDSKFYLTSKNNEISLIGGGVEPNETHTKTLKREFIEEAGLIITDVIEFITIDCYWITKNNKHMNSLSNIYIVKVKDTIKEPTEKESKLIILDKKDILNNLSLPYQKEAIKLYIKN